jgi:hypothetical protein
MAIINVSSATMSDQSGVSFQNVINSASSGDTLLIASGVYSFNPAVGHTLITVNKSLNIATQTNGFPATLIGTYGPPVPSPSNGYASSLPVTIQNAGGTPSGIVIQFTSGTDGHIRVDGIQFQQVGNNAGASGDMCLGMDRTDMGGPGSPGTQYTVIFTNCIFESGGVFNYVSFAGANGIIMSHCTFDSGTFNAATLVGISWTTSKYGIIGSGGHNYWNTPDTMGLVADSTGLNVGDTAQGWCGVAGLNCTYIEDSTIINGTSGAMNGDDNSRVVVRHCNVIDSSLFSHGQDTGPSGNRHYEVYNNLMQSRGNTQAQHWWGARGAVALVANNQMDATNHSSIDMQCQQCRRTSGQTACQVLPGPANRQVGIGWSASSSAQYGNPVQTQDGTGQVIDPCYYWNNTGTGGYNGGTNPNYFGVSDFNPDQCGNGLTSSNFIINGTHFFPNTARPGWVPYTYPHPLVSGLPQPPGAPVLMVVRGATPSFVQGNSFSFAPGTTGVVFTAQYAKAQVAGDSNIVIVWQASGATLTGPPTDTSGNTYSLILPQFTTPSLQFNVSVYIATNIAAAAAGANTVTVIQGVANFGEMNILEYNSLSLPFDAFSDAGDGSGTTSSGNSPITTSNAADLIISGFICDINFSTLVLPGTVTAPQGWNLETTASTNPDTTYGTSFVADQQNYSTGTYNPLWTQNVTNPNPGFTGNPWAIFALALKSSLTLPPPSPQINLTWGAVATATTYHVKWGTTNGGPYPTIVNVGNVTTFTISGLNSGTYYVVVSAFNANGESLNSNQIVATVPGSEIVIAGRSTSAATTFNPRLILRPLTGRF